MLTSKSDRGAHTQAADVFDRLERHLTAELRDAAQLLELYGYGVSATVALDRIATLRNRYAIALRAFNARIDAQPTYWGL